MHDDEPQKGGHAHTFPHHVEKRKRTAVSEKINKEKGKAHSHSIQTYLFIQLLLIPPKKTVPITAL
jgi:hypothetical protein